MDDPDTDNEDFFSAITTSLVGNICSTPTDTKALLQKLQGLVTNIQWSPTAAADLFCALLKRFDSTEKDRAHLVSWMLEMLHCIEINYITPTWRCRMKKTLIEHVQNQTLRNEDFMKLLADDTEKQLTEILEEIRQQELNQVDEKLLREVEDIVSSVNKCLDSPKDASQLSDMEKDLLKLCQAVEKTQSKGEKKFRPRLTQMVSWCIMALSKSGRLIQVATGEGKSCIVAMFAAYRALKGEKVDIMSSSPVLAERDLEEWKGFYDELRIKASCNCNKPVKDLKECYESQVVYGTVEEFAGDWLRQHFQREDILGERTCKCAIVDEVDSLMLDKGLHVVYLSSDMPALHHLSPLLAFIWATVNQFNKIGEVTVGQKFPFYQVVLDAIETDKNIDKFTVLQLAEDLGLLAQGSVKDLRKDMSILPTRMARITTNQLVEFLTAVEKRFPSCQFALHCMDKDGALKNANKEPQTAERQKTSLLLADEGLCQYMYHDQESVQKAAEAEIRQALCFTPCGLSKDKYICCVPGFLSDLVKSKLRVWIENAFHAQTLSTDHEYVLETHGVVPVDYSCTGVIENNMKWTDGLQQFLEMKHGCKLSDMTAITNYMSNVGMLQKYGNQIFGITGTLGQKAETETLQKIYQGITTCQIPTFKRRKLFEVDGVIVKNQSEWIQKICSVVKTQICPTSFRGPRAVLVICETIGRAKDLRRALGNEVKSKPYISNNMDNTEVFTLLQAGEVIIATNLAGRGTDLRVSEQVKEAGGLFVVQTFLPKNARVEAQAFGRAARQGAPGSAQLVVCSEHLPEPLQLLILMKRLQSSIENMFTLTPLLQELFFRQLRSYQRSHGVEQTHATELHSTLSRVLSKNSNTGLETVKEIRDEAVAESLASLLKDEIPKIKKKEDLFSQYLQVLDEVYESKDNKPDDSYLSALNEFWGIWLLMDFNESDSITVLKTKLTKDLETARQKLDENESPLSNLHHFTKTGNELRAKGHFEESIEMYTKAIEMDHCWAAVAYYNRAFASLTQQNGHQHPNCIRQALEDLQNALKSAELYCEQNEITDRYSSQNAEGLSSDSVTRLDRHMIARKKVWMLFKENINEAITEAIKKVNSADDLCETVRVEERSVYSLVPLKEFFPVAIHSVQSLNQIITRDLQKILQLLLTPSLAQIITRDPQKILQLLLMISLDQNITRDPQKILQLLLTPSLDQIITRDPLKIQQFLSHSSFDIVNELQCLKSLGLTQVYALDQLSLDGLFTKIHKEIGQVFD